MESRSGSTHPGRRRRIAMVAHDNCKAANQDDTAARRVTGLRDRVESTTGRQGHPGGLAKAMRMTGWLPARSGASGAHVSGPSGFVQGVPEAPPVQRGERRHGSRPVASCGHRRLVVGDGSRGALLALFVDAVGSHAAAPTFT